MSEILIEYPHAGVAVIRINRPEKRNACNQTTWQAIAESFELLGRSPSIRLTILCGTGEHFSAGDDIVAYNAAKADPAAAEKHRVSIRDAYDAILRTPFPVIAAVRGACVGGAVSLAMCCDFRVADHTAQVCIPVAKLSLVYPTAHIQRLVHLVGVSIARRWLYAAEYIAAAEASEAGFFDVLTTTDPIKAAIDFAAPMLDRAPLSIRGSKMQINAICSDSVSAVSAEIDRQIASIEESADYREAVRAFREKVAPRFTGC